MYKFALPFFVLIFSACNSATDKTIEQTTVKVDSLTSNNLQNPAKEEKIDFITDENVTGKLLKYGKENPETILGNIHHQREIKN
jgi:hypothetical protein